MNLAFTVHGRVQGVFFRASTRDKARALGLTGFVRNEKDGSVYVEVAGEEEIVSNFVEWCKRGPENAIVEELRILAVEPQKFSSFEIRRD